MLNALKILDLSPFFSRAMKDANPNVLPTFTVGGEALDYIYLLSGGIYQGYKVLF